MVCNYIGRGSHRWCHVIARPLARLRDGESRCTLIFRQCFGRLVGCFCFCNWYITDHVQCPEFYPISWVFLLAANRLSRSLNPGFTVTFLVMTLWKLLQNHQNVYGKFTLESLFKVRTMSPLLFAFVRDGSIFFTLYVKLCL